MEYLDKEQWERKAHFEFFSQMESPYWGVTTELDMTSTYAEAKSEGASFFALYLYKTVWAVNQVNELKYRLRPDGRIAIYDKIDASCTILRENKTFDFTYIPFDINYTAFYQSFLEERKRAQNSSGLAVDVAPEHVIHFSANPWYYFTDFFSVKSFDYIDSIPKISTGKLINRDNKKIMPMAIQVHHGLVDGYHMGLFIDAMQAKMDAKIL